MLAVQPAKVSLVEVGAARPPRTAPPSPKSESSSFAMIRSSIPTRTCELFVNLFGKSKTATSCYITGL